MLYSVNALWHLWSTSKNTVSVLYVEKQKSILFSSLNMFFAVCSHTRSSGLFIQCCRSVWYLAVSVWTFSRWCRYESVLKIFMLLLTGMSLAKLQAWRKPAAAALLLFNLIPALYTGLIHQRGSLDVMHDLRELCDPSESQSSPELLFLMPCHSTPLYR